MPYTKEQGRKFWFEFDDYFKFNRPADGSIDNALNGLGPFNYMNPSVEWQRARIGNQYPGQFEQYAIGAKSSIIFLADEQKRVFDKYFNQDMEAVRLAFEDFGQGVLYTATRPVGEKVHKMNAGGGVPEDYRSWHGFMAAYLFVGPDKKFWTEIVRYNGLAWEIQMTAKPMPDIQTNKPLPATTLSALRSKWLGLDMDQINGKFDKYPNPPIA